jgi:hypothetical protein
LRDFGGGLRAPAPGKVKPFSGGLQMFRNNQTKRNLVVVLMATVLMVTAQKAAADTLFVTERQVTDTFLYETTPTLSSDVVVYTAREMLDTGFFDQGDIWYQDLSDLSGGPVQITTDLTDDKRNDISGDYIVYTSYDTTMSLTGTIMLYQISSGILQPIGDPLIIQEPRIHGNTLVWVQGAVGSSEIMKYDLAWLGTTHLAESLTGPIPPTSNVDIGDRFVVWVERELGGDYDIGAYDLTNGVRIRLTETATIDERYPSTSGDWIVWESRDHEALSKRIEAVNLETSDYRIIIDDGSVSGRPSVHGDLIAYESDTKGNFDIYVYRISTEETFQVTTEPHDQYLNDVFGDMVAYVNYHEDELTPGVYDEDIWVASLTFGPPVIYVDADATGANNGISWADAYNCLQDALALANAQPDDDDEDEILVAEGTYKPDQGGGNTAGDREATFQLVNGVAVKGGYAGYGAANPDARDITAYKTILSGDLNGDDGPNFADNDENSYQVVSGSGTDATAVLDGFTIKAGNADGSDPYDYGGGVFNDSSSPTVTNCAFSGNSAFYGGGGMYNRYSSPTVRNCTFSDNSAQVSGGGGMFNGNSSPTVTDCVFIGNSAPNRAGMFNYHSDATVTNCTFIGNSANYDGGAMGNSASSPVVTNCLFSGNLAVIGEGGAVKNISSSSPILTNCTFSGNSAGGGGNALACDSRDMPSTVQLTNCILWDGGSEIWNNDGSTITINYSDVQGGWTGPGGNNISADPLFVNAGSGDYHLLPGSPCVDAGDDSAVPSGITTDLDGNPRFMCYSVDMGAYEQQNTAPVADAGPDQSIIVLGMTVQLAGRQSYDDDGHDITYLWTMTNKPSGSAASLDDPSDDMPTFVADVQGEYVIELVVSDPWATSEPDTVTVSFNNVTPVADAGNHQTVTIGDTVFLDGSGSWDANFDILTYSWTLVSKPEGSAAVLSDPAAPDPSFVADAGGLYKVRLIVNDGLVDSLPDEVDIYAITIENEITNLIRDIVGVINDDITPSDWKNENLDGPMIHWLQSIIEMVEDELYAEALAKLQTNVLPKIDGCDDCTPPEPCVPENNDFLTTCQAQGLVFPLIMDVIDLLNTLIE